MRSGVPREPRHPMTKMIKIPKNRFLVILVILGRGVRPKEGAPLCRPGSLRPGLTERQKTGRPGYPLCTRAQTDLARGCTPWNPLKHRLSQPVKHKG